MINSESTYSNDNIWSVSLGGKNAQTTDSVLIADNLLKGLWSVLFDPINTKAIYKNIKYYYKINLPWQILFSICSGGRISSTAAGAGSLIHVHCLWNRHTILH